MMKSKSFSLRGKKLSLVMLKTQVVANSHGIAAMDTIDPYVSAVEMSSRAPVKPRTAYLTIQDVFVERATKKEKLQL